MPFSAHLEPFGQSQGPYHGKTVSSVPLATNCPEAEPSGRANVFPIPCRAGSECSAGETVTLRSLPAPPPALPPSPRGLAHAGGPENITQALHGHLLAFANHLPSPPRSTQSGWVCATWISPGPRWLGLSLSPSGAVAEVMCRAGSYCGPQTGTPPLCPAGYACPAGSSPAQGSCEYPTRRVSVRALSTSQPAGSPPTGVTSLGFPKGSGQKAGLRDKYLAALCLVFHASVPGKEDEEANCTEMSFMGF